LSKRRLRLGAILTLLVLATTVPLGVFAGRLIFTSWRDQVAVVDRQNIERARAISVAIDQEVQTSITALNVLAATALLSADDLSHFPEFAGRTVALHPGWQSVFLIDAARRRIFDTALPPGTPPVVIDEDWVRTVLEARRATASALTRDAASGEYLVSIGVPVVRSDRVTSVLGARLRASAFSDVIRRQKTPPDGVVTLLDGNRVIMARSRNEARYLGRPPTPDFAERTYRADEGAWRTVLLEGTRAYSAHSRSPVTGWIIGLGLPAGTVEQPIGDTLQALVSAGIAILGLGLFLAIVISHSVVRAQVGAVAAARALARGEAPAPPSSPIAEFDDLAKGLREAGSILEQRRREREAAEAERARAAERLEQALAGEQAARQAAEAHSRAQDEFVATISHELRTPLNAIYGWVAMLRTGTLDEAGRAKALEVIDRNTRAQAQLVEDLLDMARVIRGTVRIAMDPVDLALVLESALDSVGPAADARRIAITVHAPPGVAVVAGDAARLQQILWNLLSNSIKFSEAGGRVEIRLDREGDAVVVRVRDTGAGIDPAFLPHVFDRFRQESSAVTRTHSGLGIGLSLVRHLTELHGGTVSAESAGKGHGSTFTVRFPLLGTRDVVTRGVAAAGPAAAGATPAAPTRLAGVEVLAVDDDQDARELLATSLRQAGATVRTAASVSEAMTLAAASPPHVVVTDIAMPQASGYDLVRQMREHEQLASMPAVAVTAYSRAEDRARALALGFDAHVGKPFSPQALVAVVAGLVHR
jgi:signal transduction histidine kinase